MKKSLPTLDSIRVESPCPLTWEAMIGDDRKRFCDACGKHVHNLSALTREEAERAAADPDIECVTYLRAAGTRVVTADEKTRPTRRRLSRILGWAVLVLSLGCARNEKSEKRTPNGEVIPVGCVWDEESQCVRTIGKLK